MTEMSPFPMTVDEFLAWAEGRPGRYELDAGQVIVMAPESIGHVRMKARVHEALAAAVQRAGIACEALPDGAAVRIDARTLYEPDALVFCGAAPPRDALAIVAPVIVVEVLSPSTGPHDRGGKLVGYFVVPDLRHCLIVDPERRVLVHHARRGDEIATRILHGGALRLDPPGLDIRIEDLFGEAALEVP